MKRKMKIIIPIILLVLIAIVFILIIISSNLNSNKSNNGFSNIELDKDNDGYFTPATANEVVRIPNSPFETVVNQLNIYFKEELTKEEINNIVVNELNGEIVGAIYEINFYQIRFPYITKYEELMLKMKEVKSNENVTTAIRNDILPFSSNNETYPNDPWESKKGNIDFDNEYPNGAEWGAEVIRANKVWNDFYKTGMLQEINVGIIDSYFESHDDYKGFEFVSIWKGYSELSKEERKNINLKHGNHVAGIISANFNNNIGISGIASNTGKLNLYSLLSYKNDDMEEMKNCDYEWCFAIYLLAKSNCKVINLSQGINLYDKFDVDKDGQIRVKIDKEKSIYTVDQLNELFQATAANNALYIDELLKKFDFLIIQSSGNDYTDTKLNWGFTAISNDFELPDEYQNDEKYINIDFDNLKNHIIIVGAIKNLGNKKEKKYEMYAKSNIGKTIDVLAPGFGIYSMIHNNKYGYLSGTSMAAPHVTGVATLIWGTNPDLKGEEVKQIILDTVQKDYPIKVNASLANDDFINISSDEYTSRDYYIIDAYAAVSKAFDNSTNKINVGNFEINLDILDDMELTYEEIVSKHGEPLKGIGSFTTSDNVGLLHSNEASYFYGVFQTDDYNEIMTLNLEKIKPNNNSIVKKIEIPISKILPVLNDNINGSKISEAFNLNGKINSNELSGGYFFEIKYKNYYINFECDKDGNIAKTAHVMILKNSLGNNPEESDSSSDTHSEPEQGNSSNTNSNSYSSNSSQNNGSETSSNKPNTSSAASNSSAISTSSTNLQSSSDDFHYKIKGSNVTITGYKGKGGNVIIPSLIEDKKVTVIVEDAFRGESNITAITIPDSVISIEKQAFRDCRNITSIIIPNSITTIDYGVFQGCSSLTSITIPNSVTSIDSFAFSLCKSLSSIIIPNSIKGIGSSAFSYCSNLKSVTLPNAITTIEHVTFSQCEKLTSIIIPNTVTSIGANAFQNCKSLTQIKIPDSVTDIGSWAFAYCSSIKSIIIPSSVTGIGTSAFNNCSNLKSAYFEGDAPTYFADNAFGYTSSDFKIYYHIGKFGWSSSATWGIYPITTW